jgi:hypothetical protein
LCATACGSLLLTQVGQRRGQRVGEVVELVGRHVGQRRVCQRGAVRESVGILFGTGAVLWRRGRV